MAHATRNNDDRNIGLLTSSLIAIVDGAEVRRALNDVPCRLDKRPP